MHAWDRDRDARVKLRHLMLLEASPRKLNWQSRGVTGKHPPSDQGTVTSEKKLLAWMEELSWPTCVHIAKSYGDRTFQGLPKWLCMEPKVHASSPITM